MRSPNTVRPIVIAAGGTGGHFAPAEAFAAELSRRGVRFALMTDTRTAARAAMSFDERYVLAGAGIAGRGVARGAVAGLSMARGAVQARKILRRIGAAGVVAFGGYPAVAPVLAARSLGLRVVLHEQNAVVGRANRSLARFADFLALSLPDTARIPAISHRVLGNPVIGTSSDVPYRADASLLIFGGSLGARVFSDVVPPALAALPAPLRARLRVTQQCRAEDVARVQTAYATAGIAAELSPFFPDVARRMAEATLVIARAGASTVAELAMAGRPSILVPLPHAIDDHQSANAHVLADAGGAWVIPQPEFDAAALTALLTTLLASPDKLTEAAAAATTVARPNAAADLADAVEGVFA